MPVTSPRLPFNVTRLSSSSIIERLPRAHGQGVPRDHQLLVGRDHPGLDLGAGAADHRPARGVGLGVEVEAEPGEIATDPFTDDRRMLADAGGEDDAVDAAHGSGQRPGLAGDAIDEIVDGQCRRGCLAGQQVAHVVADARQALEAAFVVEEALEPGGVPALGLHQIEQHAGVDLAGAGAHRQAVDGGEAHRAVDAAAGQQRAHAGAAAEMRHDRAALGEAPSGSTLAMYS